MFGRKKAKNASSKNCGTEASKEATSSKQAKGYSGKKSSSAKACK